MPCMLTCNVGIFFANEQFDLHVGQAEKLPIPLKRERLICPGKFLTLHIVVHMLIVFYLYDVHRVVIENNVIM